MGWQSKKVIAFSLLYEERLYNHRHRTPQDQPLIALLALAAFLALVAFLALFALRIIPVFQASNSQDLPK